MFLISVFVFLIVDTRTWMFTENSRRRINATRALSATQILIRTHSEKLSTPRNERKIYPILYVTFQFHTTNIRKLPNIGSLLRAAASN